MCIFICIYNIYQLVFILNKFILNILKISNLIKSYLNLKINERDRERIRNKKNKTM